MEDEDYEPVIVEWNGEESSGSSGSSGNSGNSGSAASNAARPETPVAVTAGTVNRPDSVNVVYGSAQVPARAPAPPPPPPYGVAERISGGFERASEMVEEVVSGCPPGMALNKDTAVCETDIGMFWRLYNMIAGSSTLSLIVIAVLLGLFGPTVKEKLCGSAPKGPQKRLGGFDDVETNNDEMAGLMSKVGGSYDDDDDDML